MAKQVKYVGVDISHIQPQENDVIVYRNGEWTTSTLPKETITLDELKDVELPVETALSDSYFLAYDAATGKWKPKFVDFAGGSPTPSTDIDGGSFSTIDPTEPDYDGGTW